MQPHMVSMFVVAEYTWVKQSQSPYHAAQDGASVRHEYLINRQFKVKTLDSESVLVWVAARGGSVAWVSGVRLAGYQTSPKTPNYESVY